MSKEELMFCGFSSYVDIDTGETFDKRASSDILNEIQDEQTDAEKRFIKKHMQDDGGVE